MVEKCVFCEIVAGRAPVTMVAEYEESIVFRPLGPVVEGHVLVVPRVHVADAATEPGMTGVVMADAAHYAREHAGGSFNIITSAGRAATQSVFHLHIHVVPRAVHDDLMVPWGTVYGDDPQAPHWCRVARRLQAELDRGGQKVADADEACATLAPGAALRMRNGRVGRVEERGGVSYHGPERGHDLWPARVLAPAAETTTGTAGADERRRTKPGVTTAIAARDTMMAEKGDPGPVVAEDQGDLGRRWWTPTRVYCEDVERHGVVSVPRDPSSPPPPATIRTVDDLDGLPAGTVLRMVPTRVGPGPLVERDEDGWVHADGSEPLDTALVGAAVLHVPGQGASGITREQVVEAVRELYGDFYSDDARMLADRLGLVETERGDHG